MESVSQTGHYGRKHDDGYMQKQIIRILHKRGNMRFTDLKNELGISKPVLSQHLKSLIKQEAIEYEKIGREKYYILSEQIAKTPERRKRVFSEWMQNYLFLRIYETSPLTTKDILEQLSRKLSALILFTFIRSIQTGENWFEVSNMREYAPEILFNIANAIYHKKHPDELYDHTEGIRFDFAEINDIIMGETKDEIKLNKMYRTLKKLYPEEVKVMEYLYHHPGSGYNHALVKPRVKK